MKALGLANGRPDETTLDICIPEERQFYLNEATEKLALIKEAGYVKLVEDQSLPDTYTIQRAFTGLSWSTCKQLQLWLARILADWRKVILENK